MKKNVVDSEDVINISYNKKKFYFDLPCFSFVFLVICVGISLLIFTFFDCRNMEEEDCVKFYEEHNGYVLKSCKKYSDNFGDLINVDS